MSASVPRGNKYTEEQRIERGIMIVSGEKLTRLQKLELNMLQEFIAVCEKLNLRYYLLGGTLLGAVRHKGFIPWDDDIDVGMPREDYEVFREKAQELLPDELFVQTGKSDPPYPLCFGKIRNNDTTFIETSINKLPINHGVYIDIFPLDWYPEDEKDIRRIERLKAIYSRRVACEFNINENRTVKGKLICSVLKMIFPSLEKTIIKRDQMYMATSPTLYMVNHGGAWGKKEIVPADWYGPGIVAEFEGLSVVIPSQYDKWLTQVYGNYMQLPPVEKRVGHHYADVIDLDKPYSAYISQM